MVILEKMADLKKRGHISIYNARPTWLDNFHKALDNRRFKALLERFTPDMQDEEISRRLLVLNQMRG